MKNYCYCVITADLDCGITTHPQEQMRRLGFVVIKSEPVSVMDSWWFRTENTIDELPVYLRELGDNFKFTDERGEMKQ